MKSESLKTNHLPLRVAADIALSLDTFPSKSRLWVLWLNCETACILPTEYPLNIKSLEATFKSTEGRSNTCDRVALPVTMPPNDIAASLGKSDDMKPKSISLSESCNLSSASFEATPSIFILWFALDIAKWLIVNVLKSVKIDDFRTSNILFFASICVGNMLTSRFKSLFIPLDSLAFVNISPARKFFRSKFFHAISIFIESLSKSELIATSIES